MKIYQIKLFTSSGEVESWGDLSDLSLRNLGDLSDKPPSIELDIK